MGSEGSLAHLEAPATCLNPVHASPSNLLKVNINITLLFTPEFRRYFLFPTSYLHLNLQRI